MQVANRNKSFLRLCTTMKLRHEYSNCSSTIMSVHSFSPQISSFMLGRGQCTRALTLHQPAVNLTREFKNYSRDSAIESISLELATYYFTLCEKGWRKIVPQWNLEELWEEPDSHVVATTLAIKSSSHYGNGSTDLKLYVNSLMPTLIGNDTALFIWFIILLFVSVMVVDN